MNNPTWILTYILVALAAVCSAGTLYSKCTMNGTSADSTEKISGTVTFSQSDISSTVKISIDLTGFDTTDSTTSHGFHIHETGSISDNCAGAGSHFNPNSVNHGGPSDSVRHVGDLGNIVESNGAVSTTKTDTVISLKSTSSAYIIGKAIVVHALEDDLGKGSGDSLTTGNAGARIGCCVIENGTAHVAFSVTLMVLCLVVLSVMRWEVTQV